MYLYKSEKNKISYFDRIAILLCFIRILLLNFNLDYINFPIVQLVVLLEYHNKIKLKIFIFKHEQTNTLLFYAMHSSL